MSGIFWKGASNEVILNWKEGKFTLVTSLEVIAEIIKVLKIVEPKEKIAIYM